MKARLFLLVLLQCLLISAAPLPAEPADAPADSIETKDSAPPYQSLDELFNLYQPYLENIAAYKPIYFLAGTDPEESKFQISLKYRFLNPRMGITKAKPWVRGFHIAYTQTSYWKPG